MANLLLATVNFEPCLCGYKTSDFLLQNNQKDLDLSYKMDLDIYRVVFERTK